MTSAYFDIYFLDLDLIAGSILLIFWLLLYASGYRYHKMFDELVEKDFSMHEIYFVGYQFLRLIHYKFDNTADDKFKSKLEVLYESRYVDYYLRVYRSRQATFGFTLALFSPLAYIYTNNFIISVLILIMAIVCVYYYGLRTITELIKTRKNEMLSDFGDAVSKLNLLVSSGMVLNEAWKNVADSGESILYSEMKLVSNNTQNGMPIADAIAEFGDRSLLPIVKKFASNIIQGTINGSAELVRMLGDLSHEAWTSKKQSILLQKDQIGTKMLFPMMVMFIGILIMILVPLFSGISAGLLG